MFYWINEINRPLYIFPRTLDKDVIIDKDAIYRLHFGILDGKEGICSQGPTQKIPKGIELVETIFFHPGELHDEFFEKKVTDELSTSGAYMNRYLLNPFYENQDTESRFIILDYMHLERVRDLMLALKSEMVARKFYWPCRSRSYFIELLTLNRLLFDLDPKLDQLDEVKAYIHTHISKNLNIDKLCSKFALSRTQLLSKFKEKFEVSLGAYIKSYRLKIAASFLRDTTLVIDEIIERVGYEDKSSFGRAFKEIYGESPKFFRDSQNWIFKSLKM